jgi:hypothetical protein
VAAKWKAVVELEVRRTRWPCDMSAYASAFSLKIYSPELVCEIADGLYPVTTTTIKINKKMFLQHV